MGNIFYEIIVQPLLNLVFILYSLIPGESFGLVVITITVIVRGILWPLSGKALHGQKALKAIQPEVDKIRSKYKNKPQELQKALMELYKEKEVSPFSSCLPSLLQLPLLIGLYWVFIKLKDPNFVQISPDSGIVTELYNWVKSIPAVASTISEGGQLHTTFLGIVDLAKPNFVLAILAGVTQLIQTKLLSPQKPTDQAQKIMGNMIYIFPIVTILISLRLPSALPLYWTVSTLIAAFQQWLIMHKEVGLLEHLGMRKKSD